MRIVGADHNEALGRSLGAVFPVLDQFRDIIDGIGIGGGGGGGVFVPQGQAGIVPGGAGFRPGGAAGVGIEIYRQARRARGLPDVELRGGDIAEWEFLGVARHGDAVAGAGGKCRGLLGFEVVDGGIGFKGEILVQHTCVL